jgi:imidazolonepropionase-like amidohydrolase
MGRLKELGTVAQGKLADLVLPDANPLENISNAQKIAAVVVGGKYFPHDTLQKLLTDATNNANRN